MNRQVDIELFSNGNKVVGKVKAKLYDTCSKKFHSWNTPIYQSAAKVAEHYAMKSSYIWWQKTVNEPWRNSVQRYDRYQSYTERLERRVTKLLKAKGMK